jgi:hypothetical protein
MDEQSGCDNCRAFCTDRSFSTPSEWIDWISRVEGVLDAVRLDRPMDLARITVVTKCGRCGQHFEGVTGIPGTVAKWRTLEIPPATQF